MFFTLSLFGPLSLMEEFDTPKRKKVCCWSGMKYIFARRRANFEKWRGSIITPRVLRRIFLLEILTKGNTHTHIISRYCGRPAGWIRRLPIFPTDRPTATPLGRRQAHHMLPPHTRTLLLASMCSLATYSRENEITTVARRRQFAEKHFLCTLKAIKMGKKARVTRNVFFFSLHFKWSFSICYAFQIEPRWCRKYDRNTCCFVRICVPLPVPSRFTPFSEVW